MGLIIKLHVSIITRISLAGKSLCPDVHASERVWAVSCPAVKPMEMTQLLL